jgi:hypothetical protein
MQQGTALWFLLVLVVIAAAMAVWFLLRPGKSEPVQSTADSQLANQLPFSVDGWTAEGGTDVYDPQSIYSYIDGHAEVYLAYGMSRCLARRYTAPAGESDLVLDIFEMASPEDAYGVFTHDTDGEPVGFGDGSLYRYGWLSFWQDRYFVSLMAEAESERAEQAVLELGRSVAALLPAAGSSPPPIVAALPAEGLDPRSVRFLRHPQILANHFYVDEENLFGLGPETAAVLASYRQGDSNARLLIIDYPDPASATRVQEAFVARFPPAEEGGGPAETEAGDSYGTRLTDARLFVVIDAADQQLVATLLDEATKRTQEDLP